MVLIVFERLHQEQAEPRQVKGSREGTRGVLGPGSTQGAQAGAERAGARDRAGAEAAILRWRVHAGGRWLTVPSWDPWGAPGAVRGWVTSQVRLFGAREEDHPPKADKSGQLPTWKHHVRKLIFTSGTCHQLLVPITVHNYPCIYKQLVLGKIILN